MRRVAGVDTLLLSHMERGSFSIAREWTDWGAPSVYDDPSVTVCRFDPVMLLELIALIDPLAIGPTNQSRTKGV
jgi:hypothetical protein